ncbi:hypothetical protein [Marinobacter sp.]|uniref:hypothetical protein n=1 Tax=Marinobacter sp. TaxID=50741 RepID=UPI003A92EA07
MSKIILASIIATATAITVFFLPFLEIYSGYYLGPLFSSILHSDNHLSYTIPMLLTAISAGILITLASLVISRSFFAAEELAAAIGIPGITLSFSSNLIGRYDLTLNLLFTGALVTTLIIIQLLARRRQQC